ncbi:MAG: hypothetical protein OSA99_20805 [Acidimicrobiales bacterium]|nr:hypothetical protein [Acidimicrobiales bacterium]
MTDDASPVVEAARAFVSAVAWGEHERVWSLLSDEGRRTVLRIATRRGMDEGLADRLVSRTADRDERSSFLVDLVNGLRADLGGTDLDHVDFEVGAPAALDGLAADDGDLEWTNVMVVEPPQPGLASLGGVALPVATFSLILDDQGWRVSRVVPQARP